MRRSHCLLLLVCLCFAGAGRAADVSGPATNASVNYGPLLSRFPLTLDAGERMEVLGPLFYREQREADSTVALPPFFSHTANPEADSEERDFLYPVLTYDRFGGESRWQLFQLFSLARGSDQEQNQARRFTIFPFYFQQRSTDEARNYTALFPFYGQLKNRLFKDEIRFTAFPLFARTRKRDVITDNYVFPFVHVRHGDSLEGWQFWPFYGQEHKGITSRTNGFGEAELIPGHEKSFALWPVFLNQTSGIGTENPQVQHAVLPLFATLRSPNRDSTTALWPFFTWTDDREKRYREWDFPWPFLVVARGEGKTTTRVFPFFSQAQSTNAQSDFYLWPLYKYNRLHSDPLDRERTRILLFLYSDVREQNTATGKARSRHALWPLFTRRQDFDGNTRLQLLAPIEPLLPNSKSVDRNWSPLWSLWRSERNPTRGTASHSLLWNLYRSETTPTTKKNSLLFGLIQYQSDAESKRWRWFYRSPAKLQKDPGHVPEHR